MHWLTTEAFLAALDTRLAQALAGPAAKVTTAGSRSAQAPSGTGAKSAKRR